MLYIVAVGIPYPAIASVFSKVLIFKALNLVGAGGQPSLYIFGISHSFSQKLGAEYKLLV